MRYVGYLAVIFAAYAIGFAFGVEKGRSECAMAFKRAYPPDADWSSRLLHPSSKARAFN